jgi:hypothetical protein
MILLESISRAGEADLVWLLTVFMRVSADGPGSPGTHHGLTRNRSQQACPPAKTTPV